MGLKAMGGSPQLRTPPGHQLSVSPVCREEGAKEVVASKGATLFVG